MPKLKIYITMVLLLIFIQGCNKENSSLVNKYSVGKDSSSFMFAGGLGTTFITKSEEGYYFIYNEYLYYMDSDKMNPVILCNKPNCLHNKETEDDLKIECNAYIGKGDGTKLWIQYYDGNIYTFVNSNDGGFQLDLARISYDGSKREILTGYTFTDQSIIVHRGYAYYRKTGYNSEEGGKIDDKYAIVRISLDKNDSKEEYVYGGNLQNGMISEIKAYGNYIYLKEIGYEGDYDVDTMKGYKNRYMAYNIQTSQITEIGDSNKTDCVISGMKIDGDNLIYQYWYYNYEDARNGKLFVCDLDGKNIEEWIDTENPTNYIGVDDKYYYFDNVLEIPANDFDYSIERKIEIYDKNMNIIDNISLGQLGLNILSYGDDRYLFYYDYIGEKRIIYYIDKSEIGTGKVEPKLLM